MTNAVVYVCFRIPPATDPLINRVVAYLDPPACHCEIAFDLEGTIDRPSQYVICSSIYEDTTVFVRRREFKQLCYVQEPIILPKKLINKMLQYCLRKEAAGAAYSNLQMLSSKTPCLGCCSHSSQAGSATDLEDPYTFCSKHVTNCLQLAGILSDLSPSQTTPSSLKRAIQQEKVSFRLNSCYTTLPSRIGPSMHLPDSKHYKP